MDRNRRAAWARRTLLLLFAALLLVSLGIGVSIVSLRDRKWAALVARVDELAAEIDPPLDRLAFGRTMLPGSAWTDYDAASPWRPGWTMPLLNDAILPHLTRRSEAKRSDLEALLAKHSASIDLISTGARRMEARMSPATANLGGFLTVSSYDLGALCAGKARLLAEDGKSRDALELLVDACVYGRDLARSGLGSHGSAGLKVMFAAFREIRDVIQFRDVAAEDLLTLEDRLKVLEEHLPVPARDLRNDLKELGQLLIREDREDRIAYRTTGRERVRRSWRYFFSSRLQAAETFIVAENLVRRAEEARKLPWPKERAVHDDIWKEAEEDKDPLLTLRLPCLLDASLIHETRAALRLLRLAARYRATGEILELEDPMGGKIQTMHSKGFLIAWHGPANGNGPWRPKGGERDSYYSTQTIEVPQR